MLNLAIPDTIAPLHAGVLDFIGVVGGNAGIGRFVAKQLASGG